MSRPTIYQNLDNGAPVVNNTWGNLYLMLKKVLVEGYGDTTVSIEQYPFDTSKVLITSPVALSTNSHWVVKETTDYFDEGYKFLTTELWKQDDSNYLYIAEHDNTTMSFPKADGIILWKKPLGWTIKFEDATQNKIVFVNAKGWHLRVHDAAPTGWTSTWAKCARVTLGKDMWDIDTYKEYPTPYSEVQPKYAFDSFDWNGIRPSLLQWTYAYNNAWNTGSGSNAPTDGFRHWSIIGDENTFYLFLSSFSNHDKAYHAYGVTGINSYYENDDNAFAIWGNTIASNAARYWHNMSSLFLSQTQGLSNNNNEPHHKNSYIYRTLGQIDFSYPSVCKTMAVVGNSDIDHRSGRTGWGWDDGLLKSISLFPMYVVEKNFRMRGELVGAKFIPQNIDSVAIGAHNSNIICDSVFNNMERKIAIFNFRHRFDTDQGINYVAMELDTDWSERIYKPEDLGE